MSFFKQFDAYFSDYKKTPIIIYGLGDNAKKIFNEIIGYDFCALTANDHFGEIFFGRTVVPLEEALNRGKVLIIAAMPHTTNIIFERIKDKVPRDFPVYDIRGHRLDIAMNCRVNPYWEKSVEELQYEIKKHDVISFDIFDTLIVRRVLYPKNVFDIVERSAREKDVELSFSIPRIKAERDLSGCGGYPTLEEIYIEMGRKQRLDSIFLQELLRSELEAETRLVCPRQSMVDVFHWAKSIGKIVILTSDMYLRTKDMEEILSKCGIYGYEELFISCECKASKRDGKLFEYIKKRFPGQSILHIGDNEIDDLGHAQEHSLHSYGVMSPFAMLCTSSMVHVVDSVQNVDDALLLGHIIADVFNDPFVLHRSMGKVGIYDVRTLAEICFLPITMRYIQFIFKYARRMLPKDTVFLFVSRDGYLLQKIYNQLENQYQLPTSIYFYTSRKAATGAMIYDECDIDVLCSDLESLPIKNLRQILERRFQVEFPNSFDMDIERAINLWGKDGIKKRIYEHKETIFSSCGERRKGYINYLNQLNLGKRELYLVDIITRGTAVYALARMLGHPVHLIACFGDHLPNAYVKDMGMCKLLFGNIEYTSKMSGLNQILETIYASSENQLAGFSVDGEKVYVPNSHYDGEFLCNLQREISNLIEDYFDEKWPLRELSNDFVVTMLDALHSTHSNIGEDIMSGFDFYDPLEKNSHCNALRCYRMSK